MGQPLDRFLAAFASIAVGGAVGAGVSRFNAGDTRPARWIHTANPELVQIKPPGL